VAEFVRNDRRAATCRTATLERENDILIRLIAAIDARYASQTERARPRGWTDHNHRELARGSLHCELDVELRPILLHEIGDLRPTARAIAAVHRAVPGEKGTRVADVRNVGACVVSGTSAHGLRTIGEVQVDRLGKRTGYRIPLAEHNRQSEEDEEHGRRAADRDALSAAFARVQHGSLQ
jgi:hypothetical protein